MRKEGTYPGSTYDPMLCPFWPSTFRQHGYRTAQVGKWHTGVDAGWGRDWDDQYVWNRPDNPDNADSYYKDQVVDINGKRQTVTGYPTDNYTRWACDYIRNHAQQSDKPWYLWLCYGAIHGPTTPAQRHQGQLSGKPSPLPIDILGPRSGKPSYLADRQAWEKNDRGEVVMSKTGQPHSQWMQQVNECMMSVDEGVGQLIEALKESGQWENTLIIYTSDQGFANGEHGLRQKVSACLQIVDKTLPAFDKEGLGIERKHAEVTEASLKKMIGNHRCNDRVIHSDKWESGTAARRSQFYSRHTRTFNRRSDRRAA
jgi:arylsulfatase A-like enzyme